MPTELDRIREACASQEYRALGLRECVEIAEEVERFYQSTPLGRFPALSVALVVDRFKARGFSPSDVRECAEEALANIRKGTRGTIKNGS